MSRKPLSPEDQGRINSLNADRTFLRRRNREKRAAAERILAAAECSYPHCRCIVSTSTTQPSPICPKTGEPAP